MWLFRREGNGVTGGVNIISRLSRLSREAKKAAQLATLLGLATGNFSAAGAGMLARSGASSFVPWKDVQRVRYDDARHTIYLKNGWRARAALFCTVQSYPLAQGWVQRMCCSA